MDHVYMFAGQLNEILDDGKMSVLAADRERLRVARQRQRQCTRRRVHTLAHPRACSRSCHVRLC